ncbi:MAG: PEP-CTERM sorting domain-containing protein, partial [Verrucomicrobiae bacterium]|nr:PEP-CTERM sorting domain-containing protein [Verrucomicrobiae bacterium]
ATATLLGADGTVNFNNKVTTAGINARVSDMDGNFVSGADYVAQLAWGTASDALAPIGAPVAFYSDKDTKYGYVNGGVVSVADMAGAAGFIAMLTWSPADGADYASAKAAGGQTGMSNVIPVTLGGNGEPPALPADLVGMEAFALSGEAIPEPSTFALGLIGIGALMLRRRK